MSDTPLLEADHLEVLFPVRSRKLLAGVSAYVHAVDDVTLSLTRARRSAWSASRAAARAR